MNRSKGKVWYKVSCNEQDMLLNPNFKMTASFVNIARTIASTSKSIY